MRTRPLRRSRCAPVALALTLGWASAARAQQAPEAPREPAGEAAPPAPDEPTADASPTLPPGGGTDAHPRAPEAAPVPIPPPAVPVPEVKRAPSPDEVFSGRPVRQDDGRQAQEHSWFDASRSWVGRLFFSPVVRLDRFFSDETELDPERAQSFARVRGGLRLRQDGKPVRSVDVLAQLYLPGAERWLDRFRLVLSGVTDSTDQDLTEESAGVGPLARRRSSLANLELRFGAFRNIRSSVDLGAGVLFRLPPGAFARARYRLAVPIDDLMVARLSYQVFWRTDYLLGTELTSALEWPVTPSSMIRLGGGSQVAMRKTHGLEYGLGLSYSHAFTPTAAVAVGAGAEGATRSPVFIDKYRVYVRLRHDVLRRWIFVEAEPELGWPWNRDRGRYRAFAVMLRVELQFQGDGAVAATPE